MGRNLPARSPLPRICSSLDALALPALLADFNGDGLADLAMGGPSIMLGAKGGAFLSPRVFRISSKQPVSYVLAADLDGDSASEIRLGHGDGTFAPAVPGTPRTAMLALDLDGDGVSELVAVGGGAAVEVACLAKNTCKSAAYAVGGGAVAVAAADVNGDGKLDLVTANRDANSVSVLFGNGDATFQKHLDFDLGFAPKKPFAIGAADFDGDGKVDLALGDSDGVVLFRGDGKGGFQYTSIVSMHPLREIHVADLNQDGKPDLALVESGLNGPVAVWTGNGDGTFHWTGGCDGESAVVADVNGDGRLDIVGTRALKGEFAVCLGLGGGAWAVAQTFEGGALTSAVGVADFNGDGRADVAAVETGDYLQGFAGFEIALQR